MVAMIFKWKYLIHASQSRMRIFKVFDVLKNGRWKAWLGAAHSFSFEKDAVGVRKIKVAHRWRRPALWIMNANDCNFNKPFKQMLYTRSSFYVTRMEIKR